MEVYAGFLAHTDAQVGRLLDALDDLGEWDNTLVIYLIGDNGASAEGTMHGAWSAPSFQNGVPEDPEWLLEHIDDFGSARCENHFNVGLGVGARRAVPVDEAGRLALRRHAQRHGHLLAATASRRAASCAPSSTTSSTSPPRSSMPPASTEPADVNGVEQKPIEGVSMRYTFDDAARPSHPHHAVLRDPRQPGDLPRRLDRLVLPRPRCPGSARRPWRSATAERWELYRHRRRLQPGRRPGRGAPREAARAAGAVRPRGPRARRLPAERPDDARARCRTTGPASWRAGRSSRSTATTSACPSWRR